MVVGKIRLLNVVVRKEEVRGNSPGQRYEGRRRRLGKGGEQRASVGDDANSGELISDGELLTVFFFDDEELQRHQTRGRTELEGDGVQPRNLKQR